MRKTRSTITAYVFCVLFAMESMKAQTSSRERDDQQAFETASLRLVRSGEDSPTSISPWGSHQFHAVNISLGNLLAMAYDVDLRYISGIPRALEDRAYTVDAVAGGDQGLSYEQIHAPLQALLKERLHLVVQQPDQPTSGYRLVVGTKGPKLAKSAVGRGQSHAYIFANGLKAQGIDLTTFGRLYASVVDRPVVDGTGIPGIYDFDIHFSHTEQVQTDLPSPERALEDQCGLKLVPSKVLVKALVIEHVDLQPGEN